MNKQTILITGGDGYIGKKLAKNYLVNSQHNIILWIRANNEDEYNSKCSSLKLEFNSFQDRITIAYGNLKDDKPFENINKHEINTIIHTAAVTRFNVEEELANEVNIKGTEKVLLFADQCPNLTHYGQISTVYTSGLIKGEVSEVPMKKAGPFANHYERSKCEAEHLLINNFSHLPWNIYRVATILADNDSGKVVQFNVVHNTIRLLFHGLISILPGLKETPIYLVTGQFVSDAIYHLSKQPSENNKILNICHSKEESIQLGDFIDLLFDKFSDNPDFQKKRVLKPLLTDYSAFESLASALDGLGSIVVRQALQSMRPFVKQLYITKDIGNAHFKASYPKYSSPEINTLVEKVVNNLIETQWGNKTI